MRRIFLALITIVMTSQLLSPITANAQGGYASAPQNVGVSALSGGVRVTWSTPADTDSGITGYRVDYSGSGISGTWSTAATVSSSTFTYDIMGLNPVSIYVRVAALTNSGINIGTYGYPWTKLYGTTNPVRLSDGSIQYEAGFGLGPSDPFNALASASFSRVRYVLNTTLTSGGGTNYADVDFYKWANAGDSSKTTSSTVNATIQNLSIPTTLTYTHIVHANVSDLNIDSNSSAVTRGRGLNGRLEIWGMDYGTGPSGLTPSGDNAKFDYDDAPSAGSYGSFQVHNMTNLQTVFAWNHHLYNSSADINYGTNTNSSTNPDSTFCYQTVGACPSYSSFRIQIFANIPVTPLSDVTGPTISRIDGRTFAKNGDTITVRSTEVGTVYLVNQSISVSSISSINAAAAANKNSVSISTANSNTVMTISALNSGTYNLYGADLFSNLSAGIIGTIRIDNTAPMAASITISASGTSILLTASETITNSSQVYGTYTISDSGSALSVTSTTFSGLVATLNLSRAIPAGAIVYFAYAPSTGTAGGRWVDQAGNELAAITTRTITNNSISSITVNLTVPTSISKGALTSISVSVSVAGKVTFFIAGKRIAGCLNKLASGTTPITVSCTFKPALTARQIIKATLIPTLGSYPTTSASVERFILKRSTLR